MKTQVSCLLSGVTWSKLKMGVLDKGWSSRRQERKKGAQSRKKYV
jgi:hypothetical protein